MCGRFALDEKVNQQYEAWVDAGNRWQDWRPEDGGLELLAPRYTVSPSQLVAIVREWTDKTGPHHGLSAASWGFAPRWATGGGRRPINARLESASSNGMFRNAFNASRCVVPMSGYYEWAETPEGKQPWYIHGSGLLLAAGLYTARESETEPGQWDRSFTIITREAKDASGRVHDRMPVFISEDAADEWLEPGKLSERAVAGGGVADMRQATTAMLEAESAAAAATLEARRVSKRVNNSRTADPDDASLIEEFRE